MESAPNQIVYDEKHKPIGVLISIEEWKRIQTRLADEEKPPNGAALMKFYGKIKFLGDPVKVQRKMRSEWPD